MAKLPKHIREKVAKRILTDARALGWEDLSIQERSEQYQRWAGADSVGKVIEQYIPPERVRVWIKDGPMKEYARATRGLGPYAAYVDDITSLEPLITERVLGKEWKVVNGTIGVKPANFSATNGCDERRIIWGTSRELKHIVWAWLTADNPKGTKLVVISSKMDPLTVDDRVRCLNIAARLGTTVDFVDVR